MDSMEKIVSLCKRRGFMFPSSEIYGGLNGCWDYGPLGVELKRNVKQAWWEDMIASHDETAAPNGAPASYGMVGPRLRSADEPASVGSERARRRLQRPDGRRSRDAARYRADQLVVFALEFVAGDGARRSHRRGAVRGAGRGREDRSRVELLDAAQETHRVAREVRARGQDAAHRRCCRARCTTSRCARRCSRPARSAPGTLTAPRAFNLMFKTHVGALEDNSSVDVSAAGDRAGHLRELQERRAIRRAFACRSASVRSAKRFATRSTRATSRFAAASSSRWRSSSSAAPRTRRSGTSTGATAVSPGTSASACAREPAPARARQVGARALRGRLCRRRIRLPVRAQRARGHREPDGLRLAPAHADERQGSSLLRRSGRPTETRVASCLT